jgi:hypothetical protein
MSAKCENLSCATGGTFARFGGRGRLPADQLIVGPPRWAYQVLGATLGERFMETREARISIDRFFVRLIVLGADDRLAMRCDHFFGRA